MSEVAWGGLSMRRRSRGMASPRRDEGEYSPPYRVSMVHGTGRDLLGRCMAAQPAFGGLLDHGTLTYPCPGMLMPS